MEFLIIPLQSAYSIIDSSLKWKDSNSILSATKPKSPGVILEILSFVACVQLQSNFLQLNF